MPSSCPSEAELTALLTGELPAAERAALEPHLEECAACRQRLDLMAVGDGNWLGNARAYAKAGSPIQAREIVDRLKSRSGSAVGTKVLPPDPLLASAGALGRLGDYKILGELGRGGMGVVFRARQESLQRDVALKVVLAGQLASETQIRRFRVEAEAAAKLDHPHIVPIYEIGEHEGRHYFSMKLIAGGSLKDRRAEYQALPTTSGSTTVARTQQQRKLARLMADIARAVHHAHQHGILHRDLKPGNVLIDVQNRPHLTDFGLAKLLQTDSDLTVSNAVMGTPEYMSPEQASGQTRMITIASDVYSLGAILYELLTGRPPFKGEDFMSVLHQVVHDEPKPPRSLNASVSGDLETICLKCLEKDPPRRYQTALEFAEDLERFNRDEPIQAHATTTWERGIKWIRRQPRLAASLAGLVAVFVFGFAGTAWKWRAELHQRQVAENENRRASEAVTRLELDHVESLFQANDSSQALALLARLLRHQPTNRVVAERLMSALSDRRFCLPVAPLSHGPSLNSLASAEREELGSLFPFRYAGSIICANLSLDGGRIITASEDGTARLWDARTGERLRPPLRHGAEVMWANFSPDGRRVVTASFDRSARVWDAQTGQPITPPLVHPQAVWHAEFSPDGLKVVTACQDKTARLWDAVSGQPLARPMVHSNYTYYASFSRDGAHILTASRPRSVALWEAATGVRIGAQDHFFFRESTTPFPRFNEVTEQAVTMRAFYAYLRNAATNLLATAQLKHENYVLAAMFSPDGVKVATASMDATARLWNASTGEPLLQPLRHNGWVFSVDFSPDASFLLTGSRDKTARLWSVETGRLLVEPLAHASAVLSARTAAQSRRIVTIAESDTAWLWSMPTVERASLRVRFGSEATYARFSPDGQRVVVVADQTAHIVDSHSGQRLMGPLQHADTYPIWDAQFSPDRKSLVTVSQYGDARLWSLDNTAKQFNRFRHDDEVRLARFNPDSTRLLTASDDGTAVVWDVALGKPLLTLKHAARVNFAEFNHDGTAIVTAAWDKTARVWDAQTGQPCTPTLVHEAEVHWAGFSPDGSRVATASRDKTVRLWDAHTGQQFTPPLVHADELGEHHSVQFSVDGSRLVTAAGSSAQVWDVASGRPVAAPVKHAGLVQSVRFSPDGTRFVTASSDGAVVQWNTEAGQPVSEVIRHTARVAYAEFSPDGKRLLTCSADETACIWEVAQAPLPTPDWLPNLAEALAGRRIDEQEVSQVVPVQTLFEMRQELSAAPGSDYYTRWARRFLADSNARTNPVITDLPGPWPMVLEKPNTTTGGPAAPFNVTLKQSASRGPGRDTGLGESSGFTRKAIPVRDAKARLEMIDLTGYYDGPLTESFQNAVPDDNLAELPRGLQPIAGVEFDMRAVIQLRGRELMQKRGPIFRENVRGVPIDLRFARFHALLGTDVREAEGTKIGAFILHYVDGEQGELPILYGQHVRDWIVSADDHERPLRSGTLAWVGDTPHTRIAGGQRRIYKVTWENPRREVQVKSLDLVSTVTRCAPFLIAITVE